MGIYEKLLKIQTEMKAKKTQYNTYGKYYYRSCEDILASVKPFLKELKAVIIMMDEIVCINGKNYIKATAILKDCESDSDVRNIAYAREDDVKKGMDGSQITGMASSYARKYALNGLFAIDDVKDADTDELRGQQEAKKNKEERMTGKKEIEEILKQLERTGVDSSIILSEYVVNTFEELTMRQYYDCMRRFEKTPDKKVV